MPERHQEQSQEQKRCRSKSNRWTRSAATHASQNEAGITVKVVRSLTGPEPESIRRQSRSGGDL